MSCYCESSKNPDYIIAAAFGQCMSKSYEIASVVFGWFSIICWIIALYPQMRMSFLLKRCESISIAFLILWFIGDLLNLISLFVLNGLLTQIVLGSFWLAMDILLNGQYFYYQHKNKGKDLPEQNVREITRYRAPEIIVYTVMSAAVVSSFLCYAIPAAKYVRLAAAQSNHDGLKDCSNTGVFERPHPRWWAGTVMAYITIPLYCFNRVLQVVKNCRRKEVEDLSLGLFILIMGANVFQFISIILSDPSPSSLVTQIPYLFGAIFPVAMDAFILSQIIYYNKRSAQKKNSFGLKGHENMSSVEMSATGDNPSISVIP